MTIHTSTLSCIEKKNCDRVKHCTYFTATFVLCLKGLEGDKILDLPEDASGRINDWVRMWKSCVLNGRLLLDKWSPVHGCPQILMRRSLPPSCVIHRYCCLPVPQLDLITTTRSELCTRPHISKLFQPQQGFHSPKPGLIPVSAFSSLCWCEVGPFVFPIHGKARFRLFMSEAVCRWKLIQQLLQLLITTHSTLERNTFFENINFLSHSSYTCPCYADIFHTFICPPAFPAISKPEDMDDWDRMLTVSAPCRPFHQGLTDLQSLCEDMLISYLQSVNWLMWNTSCRSMLAFSNLE